MSTTNTPEREAFLAERRKGIGGSDAATIVGLDPYTTPYQLWREKVGLPNDAIGKRAAMRRGNYLEDAVLRAYAELVNPAKIEPQIHHDKGWRRGNQDGRATMADGTRRTVEIKTATKHVFRDHWGQPWSDEIPDRALCQGLWYGNLDDANVIDFAVLVIPDDPDEVIGLDADQIVEVGQLHIFQAPRHPHNEATLIDAAHAFWHNHVLTGCAPEATVDDVDMLWPLHASGVTRPVKPVLEMVERYVALKAAERNAGAEAKQLRQEILLYAKDAEALVDSAGKPILTMRSQDRAAYQVSATTSRPVRATKLWDKRVIN